MDKKIQNQRIIEYMEKHGSINPMEALYEIGCMRLASRICDIERMGYIIARRKVKVETRFGGPTYVMEYWIEKYPEVAA